MRIPDSANCKLLLTMGLTHYEPGNLNRYRYKLAWRPTNVIPDASPIKSRTRFVRVSSGEYYKVRVLQIKVFYGTIVVRPYCKCIYDFLRCEIFFFLI